ncbi:unnamed protein product [Rotaria sordida]|uniref:Tetratricopeptide repeat protein n=1 Tax=Rotaria sordida TaxID=392033 RepID=A0A819YD63_9BILA|nr:unnamed protein product [Rotaria sordida]
MTYLIIEEYERNFENNMKILSEFNDKYLFNENFFIFDDFQKIILSISLIYLRLKNFSLGIEYLQIILTNIEKLFDHNDKYRIIFYLNSRIAWFYEKDEKYHLAINQYKIILSKIEHLDNQNLTVHIIDEAVQSFESIGQLYYQLNEYNLTIENQLEGLEFIKKINDNKYQQEIFDFNYRIANCYVELENFDLALVHYRKCVEIEQQTTINVEESDESLYMYECVGNFYYQNKQYDLAIDSYKKGLNILRITDDPESPIDIVKFNYKIGCCYNMQQNMILFIEHFKIALEIQETNQLNYDKIQNMDMNFQLGWFYQQNQKYDLAIEYFQKMLNIQESLNIDDKSYIADSYVRIGKCYEQKSMFDLSLKFYEKALELYSIIIEPNNLEQKIIADIQWRIGKIYQNQQDWNLSIEYYQNSLKCLNILNIKLIFDLYSKLGFCYQQISNSETMAIDYYKKAIDINPYNNSRIIEFFYQVGICYQKIKDFSNAIQYFKITLEQLNEQAEKDFVKILDIHAQIGFCFCDIEDWNSSMDHCLFAFEIYQGIEMSNTTLIYRLCITIAHCCGQKDMYNLAIEYFEQALKIQEDINNHNSDKKFEIIHLNNQLGYCYFMSNQYDMAYHYYDKSIETAKKSSYYTQHFSMIDNYEMLGHIYLYYCNKILAINCFNKALKLLESTDPTDLIRLKRIRNSLKKLKYNNDIVMIDVSSL